MAHMGERDYREGDGFGEQGFAAGLHALSSDNFCRATFFVVLRSVLDSALHPCSGTMLANNIFYMQLTSQTELDKNHDKLATRRWLASHSELWMGKKSTAKDGSSLSVRGTQELGDMWRVATTLQAQRR
jgi:hypothetical protein